jgi:hypothetical protein
MKTSHCSLVLLFVAYGVINAQIVNEEIFPKLPYPNITASVSSSPNGFYVSGLMSFDSPQLDGSSGLSVPFYLLHPESSQKDILFLPDTASYRSYAFSYTHDEFNISSAVGKNDSLFVAWSKITQLDSDVPPTYYRNPNAYIAKLHNGGFEKILYLPDGLNPSARMDDANTLHLIWEKVNPLSNGQSNGIFKDYGCRILYQSRNQAGQYSDTVGVGNGFLPKLLVYRNTVHCLFFQFDSSSQTVGRIVYRKINAGVFDPPVVLYEIRLPQYFFNRYGFDRSPLDFFTWGVDSLGGVHCGWRSGYDSEKIYVLHYEGAKGIQIDSTQGFYVNLPKFRFMPDGEVRVFAATQDNSYDRAKLRYSISRQGTTAHETQVFELASSSSLITHLLIDNLGQQHALVTDFSALIETYVIKNIGTYDTSTTRLTKSYLFGPSSHVDRTNRVWMAGRRDSTNVILNFSLNDVGKAEDFSFPLNVGNRWYYGVTDIEDPDPVFSFRGYDSVKADMDTVVANGNKYIRLSSSRFGTQFLRKDGFRVYQYSPKDTAEFLRFDFSAHEGDTIAFYGNSSYPHFSILRESYVAELFGIERRIQQYQGPVPGSRAFETSVMDSLGIIRESDGLSFVTDLVGAKINGKTYGTIVSVNPNGLNIPHEYSLSQNYPNPFNPVTMISYRLSTKSLVTITVYDLLGREVARLVNRERSAGTYSVLWDATKYSSGVYFYQLRAGDFVGTKKMLLLK